MSPKAVKGQNALVQATIFKKCDRANHKPDSNKACAGGTCQHTCEAPYVPDCAHKWTVRYSVSSRQREQSFKTLTEALTFQLTLSTGKQTHHPGADMGRQASAKATQTGHHSDPREPPDPPRAQALPARTASRAPAPAPARAPAAPPAPRPPGSRHTSAQRRRYASAQLDPQPAAPARARRITRDCLNRWNLPALTADAEAIASEIVTNACAAVPPGSAGVTIIYTIHATPTGLHIYTWDIGPGQPRPAHPDADAETGRGLTIIDALTNSNWGWWPTPASGGKVVRATLTAHNPHDTPPR